jgi:hypothetical protein
MIATLAFLCFLTTAVPLWHAWLANRSTSLLSAVNWSISAWTVWGMLLLAHALPGAPHVPLLRYLALSVTGCAAVAVLGARRPGVGAWNFVVVGLLAVLLLPVAEGAMTGTGLNLDGVRLTFLGATVAVGVLNYLPTRLGASAVLTLLGGAIEVLKLAGVVSSGGMGGTPLLALWLTLVPWLAWVAVRGQPPAASEFDRAWLGFRDRFGFVWSRRLQEQFNNAARHAGWPVVLRWRGLRLRQGAERPAAEVQAELVAALYALMKRFVGE